jgi:N utilization substance protein B
MKPSRRRSRELALQGLYQWLYTGANAGEVLKNLSELDTFKAADREFLEEELRGVIDAAHELRPRIEPFVDRKWKDISPIEQAILLMGAWELGHRPDIPYRVTINEAIELGKRFGGTDGHKYVNGVLDRLAAAARPDEVAQKRRNA